MLKTPSGVGLLGVVEAFVGGGLAELPGQILFERNCWTCWAFLFWVFDCWEKTRPGKFVEYADEGDDASGGQLIIGATTMILLSPCLRQVPSEHYGFTDSEQHYRYRHLDLIMNKDAGEVLGTRAKDIVIVLILNGRQRLHNNKIILRFRGRTIISPILIVTRDKEARLDRST
ncbi:Lysine-tRNA ligase- cytoplasmic [Apiospora saccharicola]|uniref:Lysine-tRNA ligase- cytoplasmic n=1 Tax=Apiospora saccharicola TaxID=335842 RepID=A0ABR1UFW9_9PEZI